mgnify:CR=1 FL=1
MENSGALDLSGNLQSGRVFCTDSGDSRIIGLSQLGGGVDIKKPWTGRSDLGIAETQDLLGSEKLRCTSNT